MKNAEIGPLRPRDFGEKERTKPSKIPFRRNSRERHGEFKEGLADRPEKREWRSGPG